MDKDQIVNLAYNILSHVQNLDDQEDAQEFVRLYLLSLPDTTEREEKRIIEEVAMVDSRIG